MLLISEEVGKFQSLWNLNIKDDSMNEATC